MKRIVRMTAALIFAAALTVSASAVELTEARGADGTKRVVYSDDRVFFGIDISKPFSPEAVDGEPQEKGGAIEWELFYGENETGHVDCVLHTSESGYEGEMAVWREGVEAVISVGTDLDGQEYSVVEFDFGFPDFFYIIGVYPLDENSWISVSYGASDEALREHVLTSLKSFSRNGAEAKPTVKNPETGAGLSVFAASVCASAVILFRKRK